MSDQLSTNNKLSKSSDGLCQKIFQSLCCGNNQEAISISEREDEPWRTMLLARHVDDINRVKGLYKIIFYFINSFLLLININRWWSS